MEKTFKSVIARINEFVGKPAYVWAVGALTLVVHMLAIDMYSVVLYCLAMGFMAAFVDDYRGWLTIFVNTIFVVSTQHSPGYGDNSNYLTQPQHLYPMIVAGVVAFAGIIYRVIKERKNIKSGKSYLAFGIASFTFLIAGVGQQYYLQSLLANSIVVACLLGFYVIFVATVKNDGDLFEYIATLLAEVAFVAACQVAFVYVIRYDLFKTTIKEKGFSAWKGEIITGWGVSNIAGELIAMFLPFAYYKAEKNKHVIFYWTIAIFSSLCIILTLSRTGIIAGGVIAIFFCIKTFVKRKENRKSLALIFLIFLLGCVAALAVIVRKTNIDVVAYIEKAFASLGNMDLSKISSGRIDHWKLRLKYFTESPIIGVGFCRRFMESSDGQSFYYSRYAHNYIFDAIGSAGIVGILSMIAVIFLLIRLYIRKYEGRIYMVVFLAANLFIGLLDISYVMPYVLYLFALVTAVTEKLAYKKPEENQLQTLKPIDGEANE